MVDKKEKPIDLIREYNEEILERIRDAYDGVFAKLNIGKKKKPTKLSNKVIAGMFDPPINEKTFSSGLSKEDYLTSKLKNLHKILANHQNTYYKAISSVVLDICNEEHAKSLGISDKSIIEESFNRLRLGHDINGLVSQHKTTSEILLSEFLPTMFADVNSFEELVIRIIKDAKTIDVEQNYIPAEWYSSMSSTSKELVLAEMNSSIKDNTQWSIVKYLPWSTQEKPQWSLPQSFEGRLIEYLWYENSSLAKNEQLPTKVLYFLTEKVSIYKEPKTRELAEWEEFFNSLVEAVRDKYDYELAMKLQKRFEYWGFENFTVAKSEWWNIRIKEFINKVW